jgi:hypothetical protein
MALYLIDKTDPMTSIQNILQNAGILTTTYNKTANAFIFSTTMSNKVIYVGSDTTVRIGDAWTSGTTLTASKDVMTATASVPYDWAVIITADILTFCFRDSTSDVSSNKYSIVFAKTEDGTKNLVLGFNTISSTSNNCWCYNTTNSPVTEILPVGQYLGNSAKDSEGFFYKTNIYMREVTNNNLVILSPIKGIKAILTGPMTTGFDKYGSDIVTYAGFTSDSTFNFGCGLLIENGYL